MSDQAHHAVPAEPPPLPASTVWLMAISAGLIVANIYYAQPLLADIARTFGLTVTRVGGIAMLCQIGTAVGMFLFVPLGDKYERRILILILLGGAALSLALVAIAPNPLWLALASFAVGATGATVHVIVPFAAHLAHPRERGKVVGSVIGGLLFGILLARTFSGSVGALFGWRVVYATASVAMLLLALVIRWRLPRSRPEHIISWPALIRSAFDLAVRHAALRESSLIGALLFLSFSAFWTTLIFFLQTPPYHFGSTAAGLFGLVGAVGALGASTVGRLADKHGARVTIAVGLWMTLLSFVIMAVAGKYILGLIAGVILMDLGVQITHISNQTRIYGIAPDARSRLNMVYMVTYFCGGASGSYLGALAWHRASWLGVCALAITALLCALVLSAIYGRRHALAHRVADPHPTDAPPASPNAILFFIKHPTPGKVKTRLASTIGPDAAANAYRGLTAAICPILPEDVSLYVHFDPPELHREVEEWLTPMLRRRPNYIPQVAGDLGHRMHHAFRTAFNNGHLKVAIIGSDCVDISSSTFDQTWQALETSDGVIGPSADGGYYLLAMSSLHPSLFRNIPWSSPQTLAKTLESARQSNLTIHLLDVLEDIDTEADWNAALQRHPLLLSNALTKSPRHA